MPRAKGTDPQGVRRSQIAFAGFRNIRCDCFVIIDYPWHVKPAGSFQQDIKDPQFVSLSDAPWSHELAAHTVDGVHIPFQHSHRHSALGQRGGECAAADTSANEVNCWSRNAEAMTGLVPMIIAWLNAGPGGTTGEMTTVTGMMSESGRENVVPIAKKSSCFRKNVERTKSRAR